MALSDETLKKLDEDSKVAAWQSHRTKCLEIAVQCMPKGGDIIEIAETLSSYILNGAKSQ